MERKIQNPATAGAFSTVLPTVLDIGWSEKFLTMVARIEHYMTKALISTYEMKMTAIKNTEKLRR